jgi:hypothetical protein
MTPLPSHRFVHIGINPFVATIPTETRVVIEEFLSRISFDWYRYAAQNYVILTNWRVEEIAAKIGETPVLQNLYILATDFEPSGCNGWMPRVFWEWLYQSR